MEVFNVYINGELTHEKVPEKELFDLMEDYAREYYFNSGEEGVVDPQSIKVEPQEL
tara:strand:+ start:61 stop:228 length:168 start_codon:yes stop_codon:yes gene_type:complete